MTSPAVTRRDHLILQGIVLIWGITAVLGKLISLEPQMLVTWRTGIAAVTLGLWLTVRSRMSTDWKSCDTGILPVSGRGLPVRKAEEHPAPAGLEGQPPEGTDAPGHAPAGSTVSLWTRRALLNGFLIGLHWYLFFLAVRLGNVSVAITGLATCALWVALLEPLVVRGRRLHVRECLLALAVTGGVALVAGSSDVPLPCLLTGIAAAAVAALFSIFNSRIVQHLPAVTMTFYEMVSAALFCAVLSFVTLRPLSWEMCLPQPGDWLPLLTLSLLCTVGAFSVCVWLQRRVPAFTIGLAANIEPVYAMIIAAAVFGSSEIMELKFYAGAAVIIGCVVFHTLTARARDAPACQPACQG